MICLCSSHSHKVFWFKFHCANQQRFASHCVNHAVKNIKHFIALKSRNNFLLTEKEETTQFNATVHPTVAYVSPENKYSNMYSMTIYVGRPPGLLCVYNQYLRSSPSRVVATILYLFHRYQISVIRILWSCYNTIGNGDPWSMAYENKYK